MGTIDAYSLEDFDRMVAINVRAAFVGVQAAARSMKDGGRIVLIGSNTAIRTGFPGASVYSMTKAALTGLVRGAAIDLAPRAITVNNVQPGPTATEMNSAHAESVKPLIPLKRMGDVSEIASLVSYLASEDAGLITGASSPLTAGTSRRREEQEWKERRRMARPKEFDRDSALRKAIRLFSQQGFAATSTDDLMRAMDVGRRSMYDTFGDKRALFLKALEI